MNNSAVRLLNRDDCRALAALEGECFSDGWSVSRFRSAMEQNIFEALGVDGGSGLQAYVAVYHIVDEVEILNLGVAEEVRGKGLGRRFLRDCLAWWRMRGVTRVMLDVRPSNIAAVRLYLGCGFLEAGRRPGYFQDTGEDAILMEWSPPGADISKSCD